MMSYVCLRSLIDSATADSVANESMIRIVGCFDNEEVGSATTMGAASNLMQTVLQRMNNDPATYDAAIRRSLLVSADMAHAVHPNYAELHEENHRPAIHKGTQF